MSSVERTSTEAPRTFADQLNGIVDGNTRGFIVITGEFNINYHFLSGDQELGELEHGALVEPLSVDFAQYMLEEFPEEELSHTAEL